MTNSLVDTFSGHTIICGWNEHALQVLKELEAAGQKVVIIAREQPEGLDGTSALFIKGDAANDDVLKQAGIMTASSAIILSEGARTLPADSVDARAILTALAIETLKPEIYSVLEILNPANEIHARRVNADNVIFCDSLIANVIALCTSQRGISSFVDDILSHSDRKSSLCTVDVAPQWEGKTLGELFASLRAENDLPLGVMRRGPSTKTEEWIHEINPSEDSVVSLPLKVVYISCEKK